VGFDEPFAHLFNQGVIICQKQKMSKSRGNVITPDEYVRDVGADAVRAYLMFIGPWEHGGEWDDSGLSGVSRWLNRVWNLVLASYVEGKPSPGATRAKKELLRFTHKTIKRVTEDLERFRFNTMIAALMEFTNYLSKAKESRLVDSASWSEAIDVLLLLVAPTTPHLAEELWERTGHPYSIHSQSFPTWDDELVREEEFTLVIQVNGKVRDRVELPVDVAEETARSLALETEGAKRHTEGKQIVKTIFVPGRLVNIVAR